MKLSYYRFFVEEIKKIKSSVQVPTIITALNYSSKGWHLKKYLFNE